MEGLIRPSNPIKRFFSDPLFGQIMVFSLPVMAMNCLQLLFNTSDMVIIGLFSSSDALAAIGATGAIINLIVNLFMGLTAGTSVAVAQEYGSGNMEGVSKSSHTSIAISLLGGAAVTILGLLLSRPLAVMMGTPANIIDLSVLYLKIYFLSMPASLVYNFGAAILRAVGDSKRPMYFLLITSVLHVALNLLFVAVFHMSVEGVAWSTVIAQYLSAVLILICLAQQKSAVRFIPKQLRIDREKLGFILKIGLPAGIQGLLFSISNVMVQSAVNSFGSTMIAACAAAGNIEGYLNTTSTGYYNAAITYTAQNMGAKKYDRIDAVAKVCSVYIFITWVVVGGLALVFAKPLLSIFTTDPAVVALGEIRLRVILSLFFSCGFMNVFPGMTRAMGYSISPMICTLVGNCILRIAWIYTVFAWFPFNTVLFACYPITWTVAGIGQVIIYLYARKKLRTNQLAQSS